MRPMIWAMAAMAMPVLAQTRVTAPFPVDASSEAMVAVLNTCTAASSYQVVMFNSQTGEQVATQQGTLAFLRSATVTFVPGAHRDAIVAVVTSSCNRSRSSVTVRDRVTKVASFVSGSGGDGTGI